MYEQLQKLRGVSTQQRLSALKTMFGDDAETLQALTVMIEKGADGYKEVQAKMAGQASLQERVNQQLGTLKNLWDAASGTFTNALVAFGESIAPELHALTEWIGKTAEATQAWAKEHPGLASGIMKVVSVIGLVLVGLGGLAVVAGTILGPLAMIKFVITTLGISIGGMGTMLTSVFGVIKTGIFAVGRAMLMNPIGLAITAIAVGAYLIYRNWEPIKAFFTGIWSQIQQAVSGGIGGISALIVNWSPLGLFYSAFAAVMGYFGIELPGKFTEFGSQIMNGLVNGIVSGIQAAKDAIGAAADSVTGFFKEKLGIHSPSRVFAEFGGFTMQGLEQGLSGSEDGPVSAVGNMAKKLAGIGAGLTLGSAAMAVDMPTDVLLPPALPALSSQPQIQSSPIIERLFGELPQSPAISEAFSTIRQQMAGAEKTKEKVESEKKPISFDDRPVSQSPRGNAQNQAATDSGGGNTYQITINPAPGTDPQAIAALVAKEIERIEARKAASRRSRLRDTE